MAIYSNLPVFKASYDLVMEVFGMCGSLPKDYKYTVGERLKNTIMDLMLGIYKANITTDRLPVLRLCQQQIVEIKLYLRLLHDLKQLSVKRFVALAEIVEEISRQVAAWVRSTEKVNRQNEYIK